MAGPLTRQAQNEAVVRYGPQRFALREILAQIIQARDTSLRQADAYNRAMQHVIGTARGETQQNYGAAKTAASGTRELVDEHLSAIGAAASPFAAAIARERGGAADRFTSSETGALQELTNRRLEAASGAQYQRQAAQGQYATDVGKVRRSYEELASEEGAFTQGRVGELRKEQADRQFQRDLAEFNQSQQNKRSRSQIRSNRRSQRETHRHNVAMENKPSSKTPRTIGPNGPKVASQEAHTSLWERYQSALPDARNAKQDGATYAETVNDLTNGVPSQTLTTKDGKKVKDPGIQKRGKLAALVAADYAYYGGITQRTLDILHSRGFSVRDLKLKRAPKASPKSLTNTVTQGAQDIAGILGGIGK